MRFRITLLNVFILLVLILPLELFSIDPYNFKTDTKSYWIVMDKMTWPDAAEYAVENGGYLAAINSQEEQDAIFDAIINGAKIPADYTTVYDGGGIAYIWIGATDQKEESVWLWDGNDDGDGENFWNGQGMGGDGTGKPVNNAFWNWGGKSSSVAMEPDNFNGNQNSAAIAMEPWPKNLGLMGDTGEWNDIASSNKIYFVVEFDFADIPGKCQTPQGDELVCDKEGSSQYQVNEVENATEYIWSLNPQEAGVIDGSTDQVNIDWDMDFYGSVAITVYAANPLGEGEVSDPLIVDISSLPDTPYSISGEKELCKDAEDSNYSIDEISGADSYLWEIMPEDAGMITGETASAIVDWNEDFTGETIISVVGVNDCGTGEASELSVYIISAPDKPEMPTGDTDLDKNPNNTTYTIPDMEYVTEYIWVLSPENAGVISNDMNNATVDWNEDFSGQATLSVAGVNDCGEGAFSDDLLITISEEHSSVFESHNNLSLYPNPCSGDCWLTVKDYNAVADISLINLNGITINDSEVIKDMGEGNYKVNTQELSAGTYFIILKSGSNKEIIPLIVTK